MAGAPPPTYVRLIRCGAGPCSRLCAALVRAKLEPPKVPSALTPAPTRSGSSDKHAFLVERRVASVSGALRTILSGPGAEAAKGEVALDFPAAVLERVAQYWHYKVKYSGAKAAIPEFNVPPELALSVLLAADYLEC